MPYKLFEKKVDNILKYCTKNINTGKVICYGSKEKRQTGIRIKEAFAHGWKPRRL